MVVKLDELEDDDEEDVLTALDGIAPAVRELEGQKQNVVRCIFSSLSRNLPYMKTSTRC